MFATGILKFICAALLQIARRLYPAAHLEPAVAVQQLHESWGLAVQQCRVLATVSQADIPDQGEHRQVRGEYRMPYGSTLVKPRETEICF